MQASYDGRKARSSMRQSEPSVEKITGHESVIVRKKSCPNDMFDKEIALGRLSRTLVAAPYPRPMRSPFATSLLHKDQSPE